MCLCLIQEERERRSAVIPFLSPCLYRSSPCPPLLSLHLSPLFPQLSQENYNLTAHFNISASKWVWQALLCVVLSPTSPPPPPPCVPTSIHPSTHPSPPLSRAPTSSCRLLIVPRDRFNFYHVTGERARERRGGNKKTKTNQAQSEASPPGYQAVARWLSWHVRDHEPTMRRGIASPWCTPLTLRLRRAQAVLWSDRGGSDLIHRDSHELRIEVCGVEVTSYTWATLAREYLQKTKPAFRTRVVSSTVRECECVSGHVLCMLEHERCTCWGSVSLEVKSQEGGSVCCVFIGTMIHINNSASLPYSPFILFSSLPFDIPVCFHSQDWVYCVQRAREKYTKSPEETSPLFQKVGK